MKFSVHPAPYDVERARREKDYARHFTKGWKTVETRKWEEFCRIITSRVWSPIVFKDGYRLMSNFIESRLLALDFDDPGYGLAQATREWCDTIYVLGKTKNHQREKNGIICDRFRLVVPYDKVITDPIEYRYSYEQYLQQYPADNQTKDQARLFFPCISAEWNYDPEYAYQKSLEPPAEILEQKRMVQESTGNYVAVGVLPRSVRKAFEQVIPEGKRSRTIYGVSKDLTRYGFAFERIRDLFFTSATFSAGVLSPSTIRKIESSIKDGIKAAHREHNSL